MHTPRFVLPLNEKLPRMPELALASMPSFVQFQYSTGTGPVGWRPLHPAAPSASG